MLYQRDPWAEATLTMWCLLHPTAVTELGSKLPPELWKTHCGLVFAAFLSLSQKKKPLNLRGALEESQGKAHEGSVLVGWKMMIEMGASTAVMRPELVQVAIDSMWQAHAETERAKRIEKLAMLSEVDHASYLAELDALVRLEQAGNTYLQTPPTESLVDLNAAKLDTAESLLGDGLLNRSGLMWLHGSDGTGKTCLALQLASSLALGRPWLEHYDTTKCRVLYIQGELSRAWWQKRSRLLQDHERARAHSMDEDSTIGDLTFCHERFSLARMIRTGRNWYVDMGGISTLEALARKERADVVFIDPLSKFYDIEENSTDQNREFMGRLLDLRRATGVTFVIVHHDRKSGGDEGGHEMRGSSVLRADADSSVRLQYVTSKKASFSKTEIYLVWEKVRHAKSQGKLRLNHCEGSAFFEALS